MNTTYKKLHQLVQAFLWFSFAFSDITGIPWGESAAYLFSVVILFRYYNSLKNRTSAYETRLGANKNALHTSSSKTPALSRDP